MDIGFEKEQFLDFLENEISEMSDEDVISWCNEKVSPESKIAKKATKYFILSKGIKYSFKQIFAYARYIIKGSLPKKRSTGGYNPDLYVNLLKGWGFEEVKDNGDTILKAPQKTQPGPRADPGDPGDRRKRWVESLLRPGQARFRQRIGEAFEWACPISGADCKEVLEAAHIKPFSEGGEDNLENGILLRIDFHRLFDAGMMAFDSESNSVVFSEECGDLYRDFDGKKVDLSSCKQEYLDLRWNEFGVKSRKHESR